MPKRVTRREGNEENLVTRRSDGERGALAQWEPQYVTAKDLARLLVEDPVYLSVLRRRMQTGDIAPAVENMIWERAFGKVKEEIEVKRVESIRIVHEYLPEESQEHALRALPADYVEAKLLGEHTEQPPASDGAGDGVDHRVAVVRPAGAGDEESDEVSGS